MPPSKTSDPFGLKKAAPAPAQNFGLLSSPSTGAPLDFSRIKMQKPSLPIGISSAIKPVIGYLFPELANANDAIVAAITEGSLKPLSSFLSGYQRRAYEEAEKTRPRFGVETAEVIAQKNEAFMQTLMDTTLGFVNPSVGIENTIKGIARSKEAGDIAHMVREAFPYLKDKAEELGARLAGVEKYIDVHTIIKNENRAAFEETVKRAADVATGKAAPDLDDIQTAPSVFQSSRRFEQQAEGGYVPEKVEGMSADFDIGQIARNPIEVGVFDRPVDFPLPNGGTARIEAGVPYVVSGHNRLELLRRNAGEIDDIDKYVRVVNYEGTEAGVRAAVRDSIMTNVRNKSIKDIEILDNAINGNIGKSEIARALDYNTAKNKYLSSIIETFQNNDLVDFWNNGVAPKLAALKNLDWGVLQERLNFVERVARKTGEAVKGMDESQAAAVKNQVADKIAELLETSKVATLASVERNIARVLDTIANGGFKNTEMTNLFGDIITTTEVQKRVPVQALENAVASALKGQFIPPDIARRLEQIATGIADRNSGLAALANREGGLTAAATKTRETLKKLVEMPEEEFAKLATSRGAALQKAHGNKDLSPADKEIEREAFAYIEERGIDDIVREYVEKYDNEINTDEAREFFEAYRKDRTKSAAVHEPASLIKNAVYDHLLKARKGQRNNKVLFTAGSTGAGKTTGLKDVGELKKQYPIIVDSNMNKFDSAVKNIDKALQNGYEARIIFTFNDIETAFENALARAERMAVDKGSGRTVPIPEHVNTATGSLDTLPRLMEKYADNKNVRFVLLDKEGNKAAKYLDDATEILDFIDQKVYNGSYEDLISTLEKRTRAAAAEGRIRGEVARGFLGQRRPGIGEQNGGGIARPRGIVEEVEQGAFPPIPRGSIVGEGTQASVPEDIANAPVEIRDALPPTIGKILSQKDRVKLIKETTRTIESPDDAALSFKEYTKILEANEDKVVGHYNELLVERRLAEQAIESNPDDVALRGKLDQIEDKIKTAEQEIVNMRIEGDYLDEVPVVPDRTADAIDAIVNTATVRDSFKDITGFKGQFRDFDRNFKAFFGNYYTAMKEVILDPFDRSKGQMFDELNQLVGKLKSGVVEKYGFKRGSQESAAIQDWGERNFPEKSDNPYGSTRNPKSVYHTEEALIGKFGPEGAEKIKEADEWFRKEYGQLIEKINAVRAEIYPNNPDKLIKPRADYYRHFRELGDGLSGLMNLIETPAGIDPMLVGTSAFTQPKTRFLPFAQLRTGPQSERDAIAGFLNYIEYYGYARHIDPHIGNFRYLRRKIASLAPRSGTTENGVYQQGADNMLTFLMRFSDDLAGKTNGWDRMVQETIPGGRTTFRVLDWANRRIKTNSVVGSFGSLVGQLFSVPQGIASAKQYSLHGLKRTLGSIFVDNAPAGRSTFLKERTFEPLKNQFKLQWLDHPVKKAGEDSKQYAAWLLGAADQIGTRFIWNSHYEKYLAQNMRRVGGAEVWADGASPEKAIKYADDITRRLVAGRGIGEVPVGQKSKLLQLMAPFQIEVQNTIWALRDMIDAKDYVGIVLFMLAAHQMNHTYSDLTGNRGTIDPIQSLMDGAVALAQEWEDGEVLRGIEKFAGRQAGEVLSNVLLGQTIAAMIPESAELPGGISKREFFGQSAAGRYPATPLAAGILRDPVRDPLFKLVLPWGGNQLKKTIEGVGTVSDGRAKTEAGKTKYRVKQTPENYLRAIIFGKSGLPETQEYYDKKEAASAGVSKPKATGASFGL